MKLFALARDAAEERNVAPDVPHVIVSISTPESTRGPASPATTACTLEVVHLVFDDLGDMPAKDSPTADVFSWETIVMFDEAMARRVWQAIDTHKPEAVIAHCDQGESRSAGVTAAIQEVLQLDEETYVPNRVNDWFFTPPYHPNKHVYRTMIRAWMLDQGLASDYVDYCLGVFDLERTHGL